MLNIVTRQWLEETNAELQNAGVPANERADEAEVKWRKDNLQEMLAEENFQLAHDHLNHQIEEIRSFFLTQSLRDRGFIQPPFVGIYYYSGNFWEAPVPFIMGQVGVNAVRQLQMPEELKTRLTSNNESLVEYISFYADCIDYGYGIDEVRGRCGQQLALDFFQSGDDHLRAAGSLLFQDKASSKALGDARFAIEIFLKAFLVVKENLTDTELKRQIGHNLEVAVDRCINHGVADLQQIRDVTISLPDVGSRYQGSERTFGELWSAYRVAHMTGTSVLRPLVGRDCRPGFFPSRE